MKLSARSADGLAPSREVIPLRPQDADLACELLRNEPSVCFQAWEQQLLPRLCRETPDLLPSYYESGELVGVLVAATFGVRGSICHIAVAPHQRGRNVASRLLSAALTAMRQRGIRRVFLFTTPGNTGAEQFWLSRGFVETSEEKTFEIDLT